MKYEVMHDNSSRRTVDDVLRDLKVIFDGIGDEAPDLELQISNSDADLLSMLARRKDLATYAPWMLRGMGINLMLDARYQGPPRIMGAVVGSKKADLHGAKAEIESVMKRGAWADADAALRRGVLGQGS